MLRNIVGLYCVWNDPKRALQVKWIESSIRQSGDHFDDALVKVVKPVHL